GERGAGERDFIEAPEDQLHQERYGAELEEGVERAAGESPYRKLGGEGGEQDGNEAAEGDARGGGAAGGFGPGGFGDAEEPVGGEFRGKLKNGSEAGDGEEGDEEGRGARAVLGKDELAGADIDGGVQGEGESDAEVGDQEELVLAAAGQRLAAEA